MPTYEVTTATTVYETYILVDASSEEDAKEKIRTNAGNYPSRSAGDNDDAEIIDCKEVRIRRMFKIRRFYYDDHPPKVIKTGLTLEEAQAHCQDPETSSKSATSIDAAEHTQEFGPWFDGYDEE